MTTRRRTYRRFGTKVNRLLRPSPAKRLEFVRRVTQPFGLGQRKVAAVLHLRPPSVDRRTFPPTTPTSNSSFRPLAITLGMPPTSPRSSQREPPSEDARTLPP